MLAIISDIHCNLEAFEAAWSAVKQLGADKVICLGDLVGFGPNPVECVQLARECDVLIAGEWDTRVRHQRGTLRR